MDRHPINGQRVCGALRCGMVHRPAWVARAVQEAMEARRRQVEAERAAAEAAQLELMERMTARQEAQVRLCSA